MDADALGTLAQCASYCKIDTDNEGDMGVLAILRESVADAVASFCHKETGFKAATKLEFLKLVQREWTIFMQGAHGIASESAGGVSTTYRDGWPEDTLAILTRDRSGVVL